MSYDISIRVKVQDKPTYVELDMVGEANTTYNVRDLIVQSSGWQIKSYGNNGNVLEWAEFIKHGIEELENNPEKYRKYEAKNGWGTVESTLDFYKQCLSMVERLMEYYEELADCAVVWVG